MTSTAKRDYGSGGIQWLSARRARLRVRLPGETTQRSKVVRVRPKDHGGLGDAKAEMEKFQTAFVKCMDMPAGAANGAAELHAPEFHVPSELYRG